MANEFPISLKADGEKGLGERAPGARGGTLPQTAVYRAISCSLYIELFHASISIYTEALTAVCGKSDCLVSDSRKVP